MNNSQAADLIKQHRRHWSSQDSDRVIAHRAENLYFGLAAGIGGGALIGLVADFVSARLGTWRLGFGAVLLVFAAVLYWRSWRFTQIRKLLADGAVESLKDLHEDTPK